MMEFLKIRTIQLLRRCVKIPDRNAQGDVQFLTGKAYKRNSTFYARDNPELTQMIQKHLLRNKFKRHITTPSETRTTPFNAWRNHRLLPWQRLVGKHKEKEARKKSTRNAFDRSSLKTKSSSEG